jgi:hypothetical protein
LEMRKLLELDCRPECIHTSQRQEQGLILSEGEELMKNHNGRATVGAGAKRVGRALDRGGAES